MATARDDSFTRIIRADQASQPIFVVKNIIICGYDVAIGESFKRWNNFLVRFQILAKMYCQSKVLEIDDLTWQR